MDVGILGLAFSLLRWKEGRKADIWGEYCANKSPLLSREESKELEDLARRLKELEDEAKCLGARLVLPSDLDTSHLQSGLPYPVALWVRGTLPPPTACLAVVGSRAASAQGLKRAFRLGEDLTAAGIGVVSGLAKGIDASAHLGAMKAGATWGLLGSGLRRLYPPDNIPLMEKMVRSGGGVVTCFPPDDEPLPWHFPKRNLLMVAWVRGVVVVEAKVKSGSLVTAKLALDVGKDVWAMPGAPDDPCSEGTNALLREGAAYFARDAKDVLEDMGSIF
uniref:Rossmann fold nucleotide-binding protein Smf possibly involved in DNA uptake n=1 Tax=uncultured bacterium contig00001 TaxID=1181493 RepID=A0A806KMM8_9BACT|nr:Rossmann fold nucleotide-binding protein Smf possibly involved in DNA uptake [uncultured bacterium contig00001]